MRISELLAARRPNWQELEQLCGRMKGRTDRLPPAVVARFAALYRAACADLALADAYQLPPGTIHYLHQLVGRAHNQLYRSRSFQVAAWTRELFIHVPRRLFADNCLRLAMVLFWGIFLLALGLAYTRPNFAEQMVGKEMLTRMEEMHSHSVGGHDPETGGAASGFYIANNASIGLRCFGFGLFLGIGGLFETVHNAGYLGAVFGHMITAPSHDNFFEFVTAHGPFELTSIVLMAAAGMRLGFSLIDTRGRTRRAALLHAAQQSVPVMSAGVVLFGMAAAIEAFLSPSGAPYWLKAAVAIVSAMMLLFYFVVLGYPGERASDDAA